MKYVAALVLLMLGLLIGTIIKDSNKPAAKPRKPVVIYRQAPAPRSRADVNLKYLADVAERKEFRRRYKMTYNEECPY